MDPIDRRGFLVKAGASALVVGSAGVLSACGGDSGATGTATSVGGVPARPTGTLRVANVFEPGYLDPTRSFTASELGVQRAIYEGLVQWDPAYKRVVPQLATAWHSSADSREWTFELAPGRTFSDGEPVDATAVRKTFEYYKLPTSVLGLLLPEFKVIDDSDPARVRVVSKTPVPDLLRNLTFVWMISPRLVARGPNAVAQHPVGSGPYRLASWKRGQAIVLEPNPTTEGAHFERIQFIPIPQASARMAALNAGDVDLLLTLDPTALARFSADDRYRTFNVPAWAKTSLFLKVKAAPLDDVHVRQALAFAIDREAIAESVFDGNATVNDGFQMPGTYGYQAPRTTYPHDPDRAKELLREAGAENGAKIAIAYVPGGNADDRAVEAIASQLGDVGFDVETKALEVGLFNKELVTKRPRFNVFVATSGWINGGPFHWTINNIGGNTGYATPEYTALLAKITTLPDGPDRLKAIADIEEIVARDVPIVPLYQRNEIDVSVSRLEGFTAPIDGFIPRLEGAYFGE